MRYLAALICALMIPGCLWKPLVASKIGCKTSSTTFVKQSYGVDAQCSEPSGPLYECVPSTSASGSVTWDCTEASSSKQAKADRTATFKEEEFAPYTAAGTGGVSGQAFLKTRGGDVKYGAGEDVTLIPVTSYTKEIYETTVMTGKLFESDPDSRLNAHTRKTTADGEGRFKFQNLPAGSYYAYTYISWEVPSKSGLKKTGGWVGAKIDVTDANVDVILKSFE